MKGARKNYGKAKEGRRVTVRFYGVDRIKLERYAEDHGVSVPDAILRLVHDSLVAKGAA